MQASARVSADGANGNGMSADGVSADAQQAAAQVTPEQKERAADAGARTAWSTLIALLLGLAAAAAGGYVGARDTGERDRSRTLATA
jgi:hypothetical protein